jgi:3-hydroxyisobutyrate dehydrogenase-like beta-hydroxyacid dehydrogenase
MGSKLVANFRDKDRELLIHDLNKDIVAGLVGNRVSAASIRDMAKSCSQIISILPNDEVLRGVTDELLSGAGKGSFTHIR